MYRYQLEKANDWFYFYGVDDNHYPHNMQQLPEVAETFFPEITKQPLKIVNGKLVNSPMAFPDNGIIFLNTAGSTYYSQTIYQIGHELCHFYINANMVDVHLRPNMFWFEETLCEISSHLFLDEYMKRLGWDNKVQSMPYDSYSQFLLSEQFIQPFNTKALFLAYSQEIEYLKNHSTDRLKNSYVAKILLPIFRQLPSLLQEARKLRNIYSISDFETFLNAWADCVSQEHKSAIREIKENLLLL
ncbi:MULTISPECIES: hypothetical protein [Streptococcus]|uniref:hypothetical protein n=1 Tax=Streptococcus TaxID=1301 RepID=UPI000617DA54|nr:MULTISPECIES: hypothetical protein [Streptococcus]QBX15021.1 hypothetical protein Javan169_0016 [Streptococcus phage Javan169]KKC20760.1 hypothetical protein WH14_00655 [Streptococcus dysgalactiae subsp. equisimilis]MCY7220381.1 hypothetical protein [Streptococcus dysgalactiae]MCY7228338.1 hypothetical protein [Streptococcus dysgalactiae]QQC49362.1 hypothetical protein I6H74_09130 [Streptococcus dysgalactiae]